MSIKEKLTDFINPDENNYQVKNALSQYANYKLMRMNICRTPVEKILLDILTTINKDFNKFTKSYSYDSIFHLYAIFEVEEPETKKKYYLRTEKNPRIQWKTSETLDLKTQDHYDIDLYKLGSVEFQDMLLNTKQIMGNEYLKYHPVDNNCQVYIYSLLRGFFKSINISHVPDAYKNYIYLDVSKALKKTSLSAKLAHGVTQLGTRINALIGKGKGKNGK